MTGRAPRLIGSAAARAAGTGPASKRSAGSVVGSATGTGHPPTPGPVPTDQLPFAGAAFPIGDYVTWTAAGGDAEIVDGGRTVRLHPASLPNLLPPQGTGDSDIPYVVYDIGLDITINAPSNRRLHYTRFTWADAQVGFTTSPGPGFADGVFLGRTAATPFGDLIAESGGYYYTGLYPPGGPYSTVPTWSAPPADAPVGAACAAQGFVTDFRVISATIEYSYGEPNIGSLPEFPGSDYLTYPGATLTGRTADYQLTIRQVDLPIIASTRLLSGIALGDPDGFAELNRRLIVASL